MTDVKIALKAIKTLAEVAMDSEDIAVLHRHLQLIINVVDKMDAAQKERRNGNGDSA